MQDNLSSSLFFFIFLLHWKKKRNEIQNYKLTSFQKFILDPNVKMQKIQANSIPPSAMNTWLHQKGLNRLYRTSSTHWIHFMTTLVQGNHYSLPMFASIGE